MPDTLGNRRGHSKNGRAKIQLDNFLLLIYFPDVNFRFQNQIEKAGFDLVPTKLIQEDLWNINLFWGEQHET
jgi:hypothetical protein